MYLFLLDSVVFCREQTVTGLREEVQVQMEVWTPVIKCSLFNTLNLLFTVSQMVQSATVIVNEAGFSRVMGINFSRVAYFLKGKKGNICPV